MVGVGRVRSPPTTRKCLHFKTPSKAFQGINSLSISAQSRKIGRWGSLFFCLFCCFLFQSPVRGERVSLQINCPSGGPRVSGVIALLNQLASCVVFALVWAGVQVKNEGARHHHVRLILGGLRWSETVIHNRSRVLSDESLPCARACVFMICRQTLIVTVTVLPLVI